MQALPAHTDVPCAVRALHEGEGLYSGVCDIERGRGWLIAAALWFGRFPHNGRNVPVQVEIKRTGQTWLWQRNFDDHTTLSRLTFDNLSGHVKEQFDHMSIWLQPVRVLDGLRMDIHRLTIMGIRCPRLLLPRSSTREWQDDQGRFCFDVAAHIPGLGLLIRYHGWLTPVHAGPDPT